MGEGEPAPAPAAPAPVIKIFISGNSGSKEVLHYLFLRIIFNIMFKETIWISVISWSEIYLAICHEPSRQKSKQKF